MHFICIMKVSYHRQQYKQIGGLHFSKAKNWMGAIDITQVLEHYGPSFQPHTQHDVIVTKLMGHDLGQILRR